MTARSKLSQLPGEHLLSVDVPSVGSGTADELVAFKNDFGASIEITGVDFVPDTAITGAATNNMALQVRNKGATGSGTTGVTTLKTYGSGTNASAFTGDAQTLSATNADRVIDDGETVSLNKTENGTGMTLPAGKLVFKFKFV